ncbi:uncharacterized protein involved in response to NO [Dongia mobilis]|uniref:Uncharacterized protein involved in response to NO n=1 Tax=Dongia mobilis TaxID=578943 RepID=A0A4R6WMR0_9PROT|nr:NnrS family protein [Dongia mobilis]TDQ80429.1 uncharacterized protein involved in response to NO [Dongia mobilis]
MSRPASDSERFPVLSYGFRPFFFLAAAWSVIALGLWLAALSIGVALPSHFDPLAWHVHEMLFGFVMAAVAGFLLTAIPNWTGRLPVKGGPLAILVLLWLAGRLVSLLGAGWPPLLVVAVDLALPAALVFVGAREIVAGRNWRNLVMLLPISVLGLANLLMHLEALGFSIPPGLGWRLGLAAILVLIAVVGGRIIPSFTRNWLVKRKATHLPAPFGWVDRVALLTLVLALLGWSLLPDQALVGLLLLAVGLLHGLRLARWCGAATVSDPLLVVLHFGYAWLVLGLTLLGAATVAPDLVPQSAAIHALTAGAAAVMILAVMTRATRGHTGRDLVADRRTAMLYLAINLAALTRVVAALVPDWSMPLWSLAALLWVAAFGLFLLAYGGMLLGPRYQPRPESARDLTQVTEPAR